MKLRKWFFQTTKTGTKRGVRFKTGDRPTEQTFKELTDSVVFKTESNDRAKEDDGSNPETLVGHVVLATNTQAKGFQNPKTDRSIVPQSHQLPEVKNEEDSFTTSYGNFSGRTVSVDLEADTENSAKRNIYIVKLSSAYNNFIKSAFSVISQAISSINNTISNLSSAISSLNTKVGNLEDALDSVSSGSLDVTEITPIGSILTYAGSTDPSAKWAICDGRELDRTAYASLFTALGGTGSPYGLPTGTTFSIPDLRNKNIKGSGSSYTLGANVGADSVMLENENIPYHDHPLANGVDGCTSDMSEEGEHVHTIPTFDGGGGEGGFDRSSDTLADPQETASAGEHKHNLSGRTGRQGSYTQTAVATLPASLVLNYIIKIQ